MNTVAKGRVAEAKVLAALVSDGYEVYLPALGNGKCDLIALSDHAMVRIEVKYVGAAEAPDKWVVALRQVRANKSKTQVKRFDAAKCDFLAVYLADVDAVVFMDAIPLHGMTEKTIHGSDIKTGKLGRAA